MPLYQTVDTRFIIDRVPEQPGWVILTASSGHSSEFVPVINESAVELALKPVPVDLSPFMLARQLRRQHLFLSGLAGENVQRLDHQ